MTNREKYIDNASNQEIAQNITSFVMSVVYSNNRDKNKSITEYISDWLSQEIEENKVINTEEIKEKADADTNYGFLLREILMLEKRIEKLEEFNLCTTKILESHNLNYTKEKTADEMFNLS